MDRKPLLTESRGPHAIAFCAPSQTHTIIGLFIGSILALMLSVLPALAQTSAQAMPENASARSYGEGWECNIGFRLNENACLEVIVPQNAYDTKRSYGSGWDCLHGSRTTDTETCIAVAVPEGGFLDPSGKRWECLRGYVKVDDSCQEIVLPAHAYLVDASYGSAWRCERGYEATGNLCNEIAVPANAYLNGTGYGQPWTCERSFVEQAGLCKAAVIPENAYFDGASYGKGWKCDRGYAASGKKCELIDIPEHAHLGRSGNRWE
ncbi:MAG: hypothetical protein ABJM63_11255, partial [Anderseniella sp.]